MKKALIIISVLILITIIIFIAGYLIRGLLFTSLENFVGGNPVDLKDNLKDYCSLMSKYVIKNNRVYFSYRVGISTDTDCKSQPLPEEVLIPQANPEKFVALDERLAKDDRNVYYAESINALNRRVGLEDFGERTVKILEGADPQTFVDFKFNLGGRYFKDKNHVYLLDSNRFKIVEDADPLTFTKINYHYAKDKARVYYEGVVVKSADVDTFGVPEEKNSYFKMKNYYQDFHDINGLVQNIDSLARDKNYYYEKGEKLDDISARANIYLYLTDNGALERIIIKEGDIFYHNDARYSEYSYWGKANISSEPNWKITMEKEKWILVQ